MSENSTLCTSPLGVMARTDLIHHRPAVLRCGKCEGCEWAYYYQKRREIQARFGPLESGVDEVILWTLGTNLVNNSGNLVLFRQMWKKFNSRAQKFIPFPMYLRVFESGKKGNRLHVHFITSARLLHSCDAYRDPSLEKCKNQCVCCLWRNITLEFTGVLNTNVNYSTPEASLIRINNLRKAQGKKPLKKLRPRYALSYLAKYLTKAKFGSPEDRIPRAYYIGRVMWEKFKLLHVRYPEHNHSIVISTFKGNMSTYKEIRTHWKFKNPVKLIRRWKDRQIKCSEPDCPELLVIKAYRFEMERDPERVRKLIPNALGRILHDIEKSDPDRIQKYIEDHKNTLNRNFKNTLKNTPSKNTLKNTLSHSAIWCQYTLSKSTCQLCKVRLDTEP